MRLFLAVDLTKPARKEIADLIEEFKEKYWKVKWVKLGKLHLTLIFLGNVKKDRLSDLKLGCQKAVKGIEPFKVSFKGLGVFPGYDWPRVLWLGLKGDLKSLAALQKNMANELEERGFNFDKKTFKPHVTIARFRRARASHRKEISRQAKALKKLDLSAEIFVDRVQLYHSKTLPSGSIHKKIDSFRLR